MFLKKIFIFFIDIVNQRKDQFYINNDSSYQILRILYRLSNGFILNLIERFIIKNKYKNFKEGYKKLDNLSNQETDDLLNEISNMRVYNRTKVKKIHTSDIILNTNNNSFKLDLNNLNNTVRLDILKSDLLASKKIFELVVQKKWLEIIKENFKINPQLMDVTAWYTFSEKDEEVKDETKVMYDAQIWHRDVDKIRDLKIFIYLTDVEDINYGPLEILRGTHSFSFDKFKYFNKNNFRVLNKDIPKKFEKNKISFLGKKGTNFVVDTRCLHRGGKVKKKYRLILELYFSNSFFGKHFKFNDFTRPKLNPSWDSYFLWKNKIENEPNTYKYLFISKN